MLTEQQIARYSRQIILQPVGGKGQQRLLSASAAIVGRGEMAAIAALYLTAAGIGEITLARPMVRDPASHGIDAGDLEALNPDCHVALSSLSFDAATAEEIARRHDCIIVAGAAADTTVSLNLACVRLCKPLVWGSAAGSIGRMTVLAGDQPGTPCYGCLRRCLEESWPDGDFAQLAGAVFGAVSAFVGTLQATAVIKLILGLEASTPARLLTYDALAAVVRETNIAKDPCCEVCGAVQLGARRS
jgi:molybdopterin/thiamine biosynthesis adenylyltransferase